MALFDTTRPHHGGPSLIGRLSATITDVIASLMAWNDARVTRRSLSQLSDHELADIGLSRGEIDDVIRRFRH